MFVVGVPLFVVFFFFFFGGGGGGWGGGVPEMPWDVSRYTASVGPQLERARPDQRSSHRNGHGIEFRV